MAFLLYALPLVAYGVVDAITNDDDADREELQRRLNKAKKDADDAATARRAAEERARRSAEEAAANERARRAAEEEAERARRAEEEAAERARRSAEEAADNERARRAAEEETERVRRAAEEEAERARRAEEEAAENARMRQEEAERAAAEAADTLRRTEEARLATERRWFEGVRPECRPLAEDIVRMKAEYHYSPGFFHLVVVGSSGTGKSSFINAVRGLSSDDPLAAPTGIVETTTTVTRYPDPRPDSRIVWYDVPGAGTQNVPDWQYFNDLGLYIFDCIIVLIDNRFLDSDLAILRACEQFTNIKSFIVRSKSDQHILNMTCVRMPRGFDPCDPENDDETLRHFLQLRSEERRKFIDETRQNVLMNLQNLSPIQLYIVCRDAVLAIWSGLRSSKAIDEAALLNDVTHYVRRRPESGSSM